MAAFYSPRRLLGLAFILSGLMAPWAFFPFSSGRIPQEGLAQNIRHAFFPLRDSNTVAVFEVVKKGEENTSAQVVQFEDTQLFMEFGKTATITEIGHAVKARFPEDKRLQGDPDSGRIRFDGWKVKRAVIVPFLYAIASGLLLALFGTVLALKTSRKRP